DTEMAGKRQLEAAAQSGPVQRRDHRLRHRLDCGDDIMEARRLGRLAEFRNVGAGEKGAAGAGDHYRPDRTIVARPYQRLSESGPYLVLQRIDRRVVGSDDRDLAIATEIDAGVDVAHDAPAPDVFGARLSRRGRAMKGRIRVGHGLTRRGEAGRVDARVSRED